MAALARYYVLRGYGCKRITYDMLTIQIRDTYQSDSKQTELDIIKSLVACDYLFIEDLGTTVSIGRSESDFSTRTVQVIIDSRIEARKLTLVTSNKSDVILGKSFDIRIASRLKTFKVIQMSGKDRRGRK